MPDGAAVVGAQRARPTKDHRAQPDGSARADGLEVGRPTCNSVLSTHTHVATRGRYHTQKFEARDRLIRLQNRSANTIQKAYVRATQRSNQAARVRARRLCD